MNRQSLLHMLTARWNFTGDIPRDASAFLVTHECPKTAGHVAAVAAEAQRLAVRFGVNAEQAAMAGWLHDISAVIANENRIAAATAFGLAVLPAERTLPMIAHQRLSAVIACELFDVHDPVVLSAIACHTTFKGAASRLDTLVFVADKIAWDQPGAPPYLPALDAALDRSLDAAAFVYLDWLWQQRHTLSVIHPWFRAAYRERLAARASEDAE